MTGQELNKAAQSPVSRTKDIFNKMDANNDGVLSREEFIQGCMNDETLFRLLACSNTDANSQAQPQEQLQQHQEQLHHQQQQQEDLQQHQAPLDNRKQQLEHQKEEEQHQR